jgi:hypothetical protein
MSRRGQPLNYAERDFVVLHRIHDPLEGALPRRALP